VQLLRVEFRQTLQSVAAEDLIFIDESGVNLSLVRLFARAPKGKRARGERPMKRVKNISLFGALGLKGVIALFQSYWCNGWAYI